MTGILQDRQEQDSSLEAKMWRSHAHELHVKYLTMLENRNGILDERDAELQRRDRQLALATEESEQLHDYVSKLQKLLEVNNIAMPSFSNTVRTQMGNLQKSASASAASGNPPSGLSLLLNAKSGGQQSHVAPSASVPSGYVPRLSPIKDVDASNRASLIFSSNHSADQRSASSNESPPKTPISSVSVSSSLAGAPVVTVDESLSQPPSASRFRSNAFAKSVTEELSALRFENTRLIRYQRDLSMQVGELYAIISKLKVKNKTAARTASDNGNEVDLTELFEKLDKIILPPVATKPRLTPVRGAGGPSSSRSPFSSGTLRFKPSADKLPAIPSPHPRTPVALKRVGDDSPN